MLRHCKYCAKRGMQKAGDKKWLLYMVAVPIIYTGGLLLLGPYRTSRKRNA
jgi:hypothetical protein